MTPDWKRASEPAAEGGGSGTPLVEAVPHPDTGGVPLHPRDDGGYNAELRVIGRRMRKTDGLAKSTGRARYTDDLALPGMLHGKILRSPHPHARILSIDSSRALALPGVFAVV
ncbi:MAG TPA: hypothetical protein VFQ39_01405, partial [Longimicrobium sp.]|nr:hypothetical protein [Longimicrobium sp.]